jgi:hypothetical protein
MRTLTLFLCLALAGCAGANAARESALPDAPAAVSSAPSGRAAHAMNAQASAKKDSKKDAKKDATTDEKSEEWWKDGGVTREKVNAMCWMKYETGRKDLPIDKRADLVNACVTQALREHPLPPGQ